MQPVGNYVDDIKNIIHGARERTYSAVNAAMGETYWLIGKRIVEEEQQGKQRADYGKEIIKKLSLALSQEFGSGFCERNLRDYRQFYLIFRDEDPIWRTACAKLTWSRFRRLLRVPDGEARQYYLTEAAEQHWTVKTLDRNISTLYYQRLLSSQKKVWFYSPASDCIIAHFIYTFLLHKKGFINGKLCEVGKHFP